jgi:hypothetical protein
MQHAAFWSKNQTATIIRRRVQTIPIMEREQNAGGPVPNCTKGEDEDEVWRRKQCHALHLYVRTQLKCSWKTDGGLCDVVACQKKTRHFLPFVDGDPVKGKASYSDSWGAQVDTGDGCSIPVHESMQEPQTIVVCSPACFNRAKELKQSSPTLFDSFGPILRGTSCVYKCLSGKSKSAGPDSKESGLAAFEKNPGANKPCLERRAAAARVSKKKQCIKRPKAAKVAIKSASTSPKAATVLIKLPSTARKAQKVEMKCPGVTKKAKPAIQVRHWRVYTDVRQGGWRCKRLGERPDKMCSWKIDPKAGWAKVLAIVSGK